jgi:hypothetical protein
MDRTILSDRIVVSGRTLSDRIGWVESKSGEKAKVEVQVQVEASGSAQEEKWVPVVPIV